MSQALSLIMAIGLVFGGLAWLFDKESRYGKSFEQAINLMGPLVLSMVGLICLAPVFSYYLGPVVGPFFRWIGVDPALFGGLLPLDMGGYQIAMELADTPYIGAYAGIVVGAIFGTTVVFTIPLSIGVLLRGERGLFFQGVAYGLVAMPAGLILGALMSGLTVGETMRQNLPIFALCLLLFVLMRKKPLSVAKLFDRLASVVRVIGLIGLLLACVAYLLDVELVSRMSSLGEGAAIVVSITVYLMGSLPLSELLYQVLRAPIARLASVLQVNDYSVLGLLVGTISVVPGIMMMKNMDPKGKVLNAAYVVSAASAMSAHLAFTMAVEPKLVPALLVSKIVGGGVALLLAFVMERRKADAERS